MRAQPGFQELPRSPCPPFSPPVGSWRILPQNPMPQAPIFRTGLQESWKNGVTTMPFNQITWGGTQEPRDQTPRRENKTVQLGYSLDSRLQAWVVLREPRLGGRSSRNPQTLGVGAQSPPLGAQVTAEDRLCPPCSSSSCCSPRSVGCRLRCSWWLVRSSCSRWRELEAQPV